MLTNMSSLGEIYLVDMGVVPSLLDTTDCVLMSDSVDYRDRRPTRSRTCVLRHWSGGVRISENVMTNSVAVRIQA